MTQRSYEVYLVNDAVEYINADDLHLANGALIFTNNSDIGTSMVEKGYAPSAWISFSETTSPETIEKLVEEEKERRAEQEREQEQSGQLLQQILTNQR